MDRYHHGNLKPALIRAAFQVVEKSGFDSLTLRELARRAGVSHNAPYRHFQSKEHLIAALAADAFRQMNESMEKQVAAAEPAPASRLRAVARAYLRFGLANPSRFNLMFHSAFDRKRSPEYVAAYSASLDFLNQLLDACGQRGSLPKETTGDLLWASVHGIAELGISGRLEEGDPRKLEKLVDAAVDLHLAGLKPIL